MVVDATTLFIAAIGGAAIGLERTWSGHASGPEARFGGIRTFTLLGMLGGVAGGLLAHGWTPVAAVLFGAAAAVIVTGYAAKSREDIDATTEVAALVVLVAGLLAGTGQRAVASGIIAATTVLLLEKTRLHAIATSIDDVALRASARFAALALVLLPLLPAGSYGPFGAVRPRELWVLVLLFSGLSFVAWIGRRLLGPTQGVVAAGLLGGIISSTSVTLSFARASRAGSSAVALALGTVGACTVMLVRVGAASLLLNPSLARAFVPFALLALVVGVVTLAAGLLRPSSAPDESPVEEGSPLEFGAALKMTALFQVVLILIAAVVTWWSVRALMVTSAMVGLTDLDALTLSLARDRSGMSSALAARGLAVGVLSNTLLKMSVALVVGRGTYRRLVVAVLGAMAVCVAASLWLF